MDQNMNDAAAPNEAAAALAKSVALHLDGKYPEALQEINRAVANGSGTPQLYAAKGHIHYEMRQYDEAARSYQNVLNMQPGYPGAQLNLALALEKGGRWQDACEAFEKVLQMEPSRPEATLGAALCYLHLDKAEEALKNFEQVLSEDPSSHTARFGKAVALQLLWKFDEAAELYKSALERNPESEECLSNLVAIAMARKDFPALQQHSEALLKIRPASQAALEGLAACAFASQDYEAGARFCEKLTEYTPDNFERWFNLGVARQKLGRNEDPDLHVDIEQILAVEPYVIVRWRSTGTHLGKLGEIQPTARKVRLHGCSAMEVKATKVGNTWVYFDNAQLLRQIGALPGS